MKHFLLPLYLCLALPAFARLPVTENDVKLPAADRAMSLGAVDIPMPRGCEAANIKNLVLVYDRRITGVCGALPKVWQEGNKEAERLLGLNMGGAMEIPTSEEDACQTAKRVAVYQSGIDGLGVVEKRVHAEAKRIQGLCEQDRQAFQKALNNVKQVCGKVPTTEAALADAPRVEQDAKKMLEEDESAQQSFERRMKAHVAGLELDKKSALQCKNSAHSIPLPGDSSAPKQK